LIRFSDVVGYMIKLRMLYIPMFNIGSNQCNIGNLVSVIGLNASDGTSLEVHLSGIFCSYI